MHPWMAPTGDGTMDSEQRSCAAATTPARALTLKRAPLELRTYRTEANTQPACALHKPEQRSSKCQETAAWH